MFCTIILWTCNQTFPLSSTSINGFYYINDFLFILQREIQFIVVSRSKVAHHMLVSEEKHDGARIEQLVHVVEVRHLRVVAQINDGEVLHLLRDAVQELVHLKTLSVPVAAKTHDHQAVLLYPVGQSVNGTTAGKQQLTGQDGLVHVPSRVQVRQKNASHVDKCFRRLCCEVVPRSC